MAGVGALVVAAELWWAVAQYRKERRMRAALNTAGTQGDLQEALLNGGSTAVRAYLEP